MKKYRLLQFPERGDERGHLVVIENNKEIPFSTERIFYMYGSDENIIRGQHANRNSQFVLINLRGSCKVLADDGETKEIIELNKPHEGIYLDKMVWKDMYDFSSDSLLLVLSSHIYDEYEYVRNYDEFLALIRLEKGVV